MIMNAAFMNLHVAWINLIKSNVDERISIAHSQKRSTKYNNDNSNDKNVIVTASNSYNSNNDNNNSCYR